MLGKPIKNENAYNRWKLTKWSLVAFNHISEHFEVHQKHPTMCYIIFRIFSLQLEMLSNMLRCAWYITYLNRVECWSLRGSWGGFIVAIIHLA